MDQSTVELKMERIQRSTRTTLSLFIPFHNALRMRFNWYYNWHLSSRASFFHILILFLFTANVIFTVYSHAVPQISATTSTTGTTQWAKTVVAAPSDSVFNKVDKDKLGNIYAAGYVSATGKYDFGNEVSVVSTHKDSPLLVKYNPDGLAQWAVTTIANPSYLAYDDLAVDGAGNVYAVSTARGAGEYDFGDGVTITGSNVEDALIVKYDTDGVAQWARSVTGALGSNYYGVTVDNDGCIYAVGGVDGNSAYSFGDGVTASGAFAEGNAVVAKYSPAGNALWAKGVVSAPSISEYYDIKADAAGNIYAVGDIGGGGRYTFTDGVYVNGLNNKDYNVNLLIVKYNSEGVAQWARSTVSAHNSTSLSAVTVDGAGNIYVAGDIYGSNYAYGLGNGVTVNAPVAGDDDALIIKYNSAGLAQWAKSVVSSSDWSNYEALTTDQDNNVYAAGWMDGNYEFDFGDGIAATGAYGDESDNALLVRYSPDGVTEWARTTSAAEDYSEFLGAVADGVGNVFAVGEISGTSPFDFGDGVTVSGQSLTNPLIAKFTLSAPIVESCSDGVQNQDETGVDTGGSCPPAPTCSDRIKNQDETDVDCGGSICSACPITPPAATCTDDTQNGDKTGIDCGGSCKDCEKVVDPPIVEPPIIDPPITPPVVDPPVVCPSGGESQCQAMAENSYNSCVSAANNDPKAVSACSATSCSAENQCIVGCGGSGADQKSDILVLAPNGSEKYSVGDVVNIRWEFSQNKHRVVINNLPIEFSISTDSGRNYRQIATLIPAPATSSVSPGDSSSIFYQALDKNGQALPLSFSNQTDGYLSFQWKIPSDRSLVSKAVRIRLEPVGSCIPSTRDESDANFSINDFKISAKDEDTCGSICALADRIRQLATEVKGSSSTSSIFLLMAALIAAVILGLNFASTVMSSLSHSDIFSYFIKGLSRKDAKGVVYEATTGLPIPNARVIVSNTITGQSAAGLSDKHGRFLIPVTPGQSYSVKIEKDNFEPFDHQKDTRAFELKYGHNYIDGKAEVAEDVFFFDYNIPMVQSMTDGEARKISLFNRITTVLRMLNSVLILGGFIFAYYALMISSSVYNWIIFILYICLILFFIVKYVISSGRGYGQIFDDEDKPVGLVLVRAVDAKTQKLVATVVSDQLGKFGIGLASGNYDIFFQKSGMVQKGETKLKVKNAFNPVRIKVRMDRYGQ